MAVTTVINSELADTIPTILEEARFTAQHTAVMANLVWTVRKKLHDGKNFNIPYFGSISAGALTENQDMSSPTSMADTLVTIIPGEVGVQITVTDKLVRDNQEDIIRAAGRIMGNAMEVKRDQDLLGQLDSAAKSVGGTGTTLTLGMIAASHALLAGNPLADGGPAPAPFVMVHHPYCLLDIVDVLTPLVPTSSYPQAGGMGLSNEVLRKYLKGSLFDMPVYSDGNFIVTTGRAKGGAFSSGKGGGIILATAHEWQITPDPDPSLRATELNIVGEYGVGVYLDDWIVEMHNDASTPA